MQGRTAAPLDEFAECLLERLSVSGPLGLAGLQRRLSHRDPRFDTSYGNLLYHLRSLRRCGLVSQCAGRFSLTDAGRSYLAGDIDPVSLSYGLDRFGPSPGPERVD